MELYRLLLYYALFNKNYYIRILIKDLSFEACMHCACASKLKIDALPTMSFEVGTPTTTTGLAAAGEPSTAAKQPIIFSDPRMDQAERDQQLTAITGELAILLK